MSRSLRRHQERVAKIRRKTILLSRWGAWYAPKPWQQMGRLVMNEPGYWVRERVLRPARIKSNQFERLVEKGRDPDQFAWPDYKKPHDYYY